MKITPSCFESELHRAMRLNDDCIRAELISNGLDPDAEAAALRAMVAIALHQASGRGSAIRALAPRREETKSPPAPLLAPLIALAGQGLFDRQASNR